MFYVIAAQIWILSRPLMIGDKIPHDDNVWECFLLFLDILKLASIRLATSGQAGYLEALINDHHQIFVRCYFIENQKCIIWCIFHIKLSGLVLFIYDKHNIMYLIEQDLLLIHGACVSRHILKGQHTTVTSKTFV